MTAAAATVVAPSTYEIEAKEAKGGASDIEMLQLQAEAKWLLSELQAAKHHLQLLEMKKLETQRSLDPKRSPDAAGEGSLKRGGAKLKPSGGSWGGAKRESPNHPAVKVLAYERKHLEHEVGIVRQFREVERANNDELEKMLSGDYSADLLRSSSIGTLLSHFRDDDIPDLVEKNLRRTRSDGFVANGGRPHVRRLNRKTGEVDNMGMVEVIGGGSDDSETDEDSTHKLGAGAGAGGGAGAGAGGGGGARSWHFRRASARLSVSSLPEFDEEEEEEEEEGEERRSSSTRSSLSLEGRAPLSISVGGRRSDGARAAEAWNQSPSDNNPNSSSSNTTSPFGLKSSRSVGGSESSVGESSSYTTVIYKHAVAGHSPRPPPSPLHGSSGSRQAGQEDDSASVRSGGSTARSAGEAGGGAGGGREREDVDEAEVAVAVNDAVMFLPEYAKATSKLTRKAGGAVVLKDVSPWKSIKDAAEDLPPKGGWGAKAGAALRITTPNRRGPAPEFSFQELPPPPLSSEALPAVRMMSPELPRAASVPSAAGASADGGGHGLRRTPATTPRESPSSFFSAARDSFFNASPSRSPGLPSSSSATNLKALAAAATGAKFLSRSNSISPRASRGNRTPLSPSPELRPEDRRGRYNVSVSASAAAGGSSSDMGKEEDARGMSPPQMFLGPSMSVPAAISQSALSLPDEHSKDASQSSAAAAAAGGPKKKAAGTAGGGAGETHVETSIIGNFEGRPNELSEALLKCIASVFQRAARQQAEKKRMLQLLREQEEEARRVVLELELTRSSSSAGGSSKADALGGEQQAPAAAAVKSKRFNLNLRAFNLGAFRRGASSSSSAAAADKASKDEKKAGGSPAAVAAGAGNGDAADAAAAAELEAVFGARKDSDALFATVHRPALVSRSGVLAPTTSGFNDGPFSASGTLFCSADAEFCGGGPLKAGSSFDLSSSSSASTSNQLLLPGAATGQFRSSHRRLRLMKHKSGSGLPDSSSSSFESSDTAEVSPGSNSGSSSGQAPGTAEERQALASAVSEKLKGGSSFSSSSTSSTSSSSFNFRRNPAAPAGLQQVQEDPSAAAAAGGAGRDPEVARSGVASGGVSMMRMMSKDEMEFNAKLECISEAMEGAEMSGELSDSEDGREAHRGGGAASSAASSSGGGSGAVRPEAAAAVIVDPYGVHEGSPAADIGDYGGMLELTSVPAFGHSRANADTVAMWRFSLLLERLDDVQLSKLSHSQKLAFWTNVYNAVIMHAYMMYGGAAPSAKKAALLPTILSKASVTIAGQKISAVEIEYHLLRASSQRSYLAKKVKIAKWKATDARKQWALPEAEPAVSFALCDGTAISPALRLYTPATVKDALEEAKASFLKAAVAVRGRKVLLPRVLKRYGQDFAPDDAALLQWVATQLPSLKGTIESIKKDNKRASALSACIEYSESDDFCYFLEPDANDRPQPQQKETLQQKIRKPAAQMKSIFPFSSPLT